MVGDGGGGGDRGGMKDPVERLLDREVSWLCEGCWVWGLGLLMMGDSVVALG